MSNSDDRLQTDPEREIPRRERPAMEEEPTIDLLDLFKVVWADKWRVATATAVASVLAVATALLLTPIYEVQMLLRPVSADESGDALSSLQGRFGGIMSLAGVGLGSTGSDAAVSIATLQSKQTIYAFIKDRKLLPILFKDDWDAVNKKWDISDPDDVPSLWDGYKLFAEEIIGVEENEETGLVTLSVRWEDANVAAVWATDLVTRVNRQLQQRALEQAEKTTKFLSERLTVTVIQEIRMAITQLLEMEMQKEMMASSRDDFAFEIIDPPAIPDPEDEVFPNRPLMSIGGFFFGFFVGLFWVLVRSSASSRKDARVLQSSA